MDSLIVNEHPHADGETGAAHACGHHCQIGMMLGAIRGLTQPDVLSELSGELVPFAVPAEEFIEVARRLQLREEGKLEFMGGKQELIRLGEFDDVDMAMMCHTASDMGEHKFAVGGTSNGHVVKYVQFLGRAPTPAAPRTWVLRPQCRVLCSPGHSQQPGGVSGRGHCARTWDNDQGREAVNAVPADVRLEWRVRSATPKAVVKNSAIVDRCFKAGALAVGAQVKITNIPGYLPMKHDTHMQEVVPPECRVFAWRAPYPGDSRSP